MTEREAKAKTGEGAPARYERHDGEGAGLAQARPSGATTHWEALGFAGSVIGARSSGVKRLWSTGTAAGHAANDPFEAGARLQGELGYGMRPPVGHGVLTPYAGMTLGDTGSRTVRTGMRWDVSPDTVLVLEATRQTRDGGEPADELWLQAALRF